MPYKLPAVDTISPSRLRSSGTVSGQRPRLQGASGTAAYAEMSRVRSWQKRNVSAGGGVGAALGIGIGFVFGLILDDNGA